MGHARTGSGALPSRVKRHRADIATLKRQVAELARDLRTARRHARANAPAAAPAAGTTLRFRARGLASHCMRLGLSAAELGRLLGVSGQSVCLWEAGKPHPRAGLLPAIAALRSMGMRQAAEHLAGAR
jgi:DNA-binding XRE family transcriptional regulator